MEDSEDIGDYDGSATAIADSWYEEE